MPTLSDTKVKSAKPSEKSYKLFDRDGLFLLVNPCGSKLWRFRYRIDDREKLLSLGAYPEVGLAAARDKCRDARKIVANGGDPSQQRQDERAQKRISANNSFDAVSAAWLVEDKQKELADSTLKNLKRRLERDISPFIGSKAVSAITAPDVRQVILRIKKRGSLDVAGRVLNIIGRVMRYAVSHGLAERDPTRDLDKEALISAGEVKHHAGLTDHKAVGGLLRAIDGFDSSFVVRCALHMAPLVFVRPGELRHAEWSEFDFDKAEWRIPAVKMKMKVQHIVPVSDQVIAILRDLNPVTGHGKFLFPCQRGQGRPMSENTVNAALRRLGYGNDQQTGHGFRTTASTILHELQYSHPVIERQLAHGDRDKVSAAYNFAEYLPERRRMMQDWSNFLDQLRDDGNVVAIRSAA
jgi:integrase